MNPKTIRTPFLTLISAFILTGCVHMPVSSHIVAYPQAVKPGDALEIAIDVAREMKWPPATKIEKANGVVEFGNFGMDELGITAQVRVKSEGELEVTVKRGSAYIALDVNQAADEFRAKLEKRLQEAAAKGGK